MTAGPDHKSKHVPSPRHTLEEVLQSLQDLLRNDLHETAEPSASPFTPAAVQDELPAAAPSTAEVISQLEGSLRDLEPPASSTSSRQPPDAPTGAVTIRHTEPAPQRATRKAGTDARQQQLPFADPANRVAGGPNPAGADAPRKSLRTDTPATGGDTDASAAATAPGRHSGSGPAAEAAASWDDIPVLRNAINITDIDLPAAAADRPAPATQASLPALDARRIAATAAARFELELRRSGERTLGTAMVARLAKILEEVLAQARSNMDNDSRR